MKGDLSPLMGLKRRAGEKLGVEKADLYGVPERGTVYGIGMLLCAIKLTLEIEGTLSECFVKSST